jgi:hypothetical protein
MKKLFLALPLAVLTACGSDPVSSSAGKDVLMFSDIDGMVGWLPDPSALTKGEAHSGVYSLRVDQNHEFSAGYNAIMGQLSPTRLRGVKLEAWVYATDKDAHGQLEFVIKDAAGAELLHDQTKLADVKEYGEWVPISKDIIFPPTTNYSSKITIYAWRAGATTPAYIDDIKLTALR